jgi:S1-C subfamily serine protease
MVDVVDKVLPSVVSVTTTKLQRISFYRVAPMQGQGSGVILSDDGHIMTNAHVVKGAKHLDVILHNGETSHARVVGKSSIRDLAALKIDSNELSPIELGDTNSIKVGQFAIAVGNPLGLGTTATFGMISAVDRTIQSRKSFLEGLIQTSAQINPGNSGGALVNTRAELIGIPTAMIPWSQGIGFAIAVDGVKAVYKELVETGTIKTPWMGVVGLAINPRVASYYKLSIQEGVLIVEVPKGPSLTVGLEPGDIITSVNGNNIKTMEELRRAIMNQRVGSKIKVSINRKKDIFDAEVELREAPESG